jgi:hypothetical protein
MYYVYAAKENADKTEGRGPDIVIANFNHLDDAVAVVKGRGVMGSGDGEVFLCGVFESLQEFKDRMQYPNRGRVTEEKVYGYRKNWLGRWDYGYVDNQDAPKSDPEVEAFKLLRAKLDKKYGESKYE